MHPETRNLDEDHLQDLNVKRTSSTGASVLPDGHAPSPPLPLLSIRMFQMLFPLLVSSQLSKGFGPKGWKVPGAFLPFGPGSPGRPGHLEHAVRDATVRKVPAPSKTQTLQ